VLLATNAYFQSFSAYTSFHVTTKIVFIEYVFLFPVIRYYWEKTIKETEKHHLKSVFPREGESTNSVLKKKTENLKLGHIETHILHIKSVITYGK
jgi:hypothetical protein